MRLTFATGPAIRPRPCFDVLAEHGHRATSEAIRAAGPDEVMLLHDGRGDRRQTVAALALAARAR